ncbi:MAG: hypothetical protein JSS98_05410 [Bacteroidetes bacterium]|nr:hypothetical protein [Bacteroidota bacterium]
MNFKGVLKKWVIPPGFLELLADRSKHKKKFIEDNKIEYLPQEKQNELRSFFGADKGRCFILATGPSIAKQDLSILKGEKCIAVSMFHLHENLTFIKPAWHVFAPVHPPFDFKTVETIVKSAYDKYREIPDVKFLFGHNSYSFSYFNYLKTCEKKVRSFFEERGYFINYSNAQELTEDNIAVEEKWDILKDPFSMRTVIYSAIQLAYCLGFTEIILVGCDHDYLKDVSRVENHHFYEEKKGFSDKEHLAGFSKEKWFFEYYKRWKDYRLMRDFLNSRGIKIINATEEGMLDVFPQKKLTTFFE